MATHKQVAAATGTGKAMAGDGFAEISAHHLLAGASTTAVHDESEARRAARAIARLAGEAAAEATDILGLDLPAPPATIGARFGADVLADVLHAVGAGPEQAMEVAAGLMPLEARAARDALAARIADRPTPRRPR
jgi:hypothetical protein